MSLVIELTSENCEKVLKDGVSLVDFWAPWCGPCKMIAPVIEKLADEFKNKAKICKVNTDEQQDLSVKYGIRSVPTILFVKDGKVVDKLIGNVPKGTFTDKLNNLLPKEPRKIPSTIKLTLDVATNIINGITPNYSDMDNPVIKRNGEYSGGFNDDWRWINLRKISLGEAVEIISILKPELLEEDSSK